MATIKHLFLVLAALPFIPYLLFQGYYIRKKVPDLLPPTDINGHSGTQPIELKLLCIGESTVAGIGVDTHRDGIAGQLGDYLNEKTNKKIVWSVFAKSGLTTKGVLEKIKNEAVEIVPDIIVIGVGANDGFRLNSPNVFKKNIQSIIESIQKKFPDKPIVFANMPPISIFPAFPFLVRYFVANTVNIYRKELNKIIPQYANVYFDHQKIENMDWDLEGRPITDFFSDGVHPSKLTYGMWAKNIGEFILENKVIY
ncbi:MAG: SGNH/GDSL hydrolase family protein [Bacteroidota bacterium]